AQGSAVAPFIYTLF
ncbi:MAG: DUF5989 family protein, partial [Gammaproteobacteria bacterium]